MSFQTQSFLIERLGVPLTGSPFSGRTYYGRGRGQEFENLSEIARAQRPEVLSLDNLQAPVQPGDQVTKPDGTTRTIVAVRPYDFSLQCDLQWQLFGSAVQIGGLNYSVATRSLQQSEREYLPQGLQNAAAADLRVFLTAPTAFPSLPDAGPELLWHGIRYTIIFAVPGDDEVAGDALTLRLICYRTPPDGQNPAEDGQILLWPNPPA